MISRYSSSGPARIVELLLLLYTDIFVPGSRLSVLIKARCGRALCWALGRAGDVDHFSVICGIALLVKKGPCESESYGPTWAQASCLRYK